VKPEGFPCLRSFFGTGNFFAHPSETSYAETTFVSRDRRAALPLTAGEYASSLFSVAIAGTP